MDGFLYDRDFRHERVNAHCLKKVRYTSRILQQMFLTSCIKTIMDFTGVPYHENVIHKALGVTIGVTLEKQVLWN